MGSDFVKEAKKREREKWRFNFDNYGCYIIARERESE
jgi:hypothetical protein